LEPPHLGFLPRKHLQSIHANEKKNGTIKIVILTPIPNALTHPIQNPMVSSTFLTQDPWSPCPRLPLE
jgi:hypothetical protein